MSPKIGEHIFVGDPGEEREYVVVGHDAGGNPDRIPVEFAQTPEALESHLGVSRAMAIRAKVLDAMGAVA